MESSSKKRKVVRSEGRLMIANVYHFLKKEYEFTDLFKEPNCDFSHLRNITLRTAEATGVSERTVQQILKEERELKERGEDPRSSPNFVWPLKTRRKRANKVDIDSKSADIIRSTLREYYIANKQYPTLAKLQSILNEKIGFDGCLATLRKLLIKLGYTWNKGDKKKKILVEQIDTDSQI